MIWRWICRTMGWDWYAFCYLTHKVEGPYWTKRQAQEIASDLNEWQMWSTNGGKRLEQWGAVTGTWMKEHGVERAK